MRTFFSLLLFCSVTGCAPDKPKNYSNNMTTAPPAPVKDSLTVTTPPIPITALELTSAYIANEVRADRDYRDKMVEVTGIILDIKQSLGDGVFVVLEGSEKFRAVQCYVNDEEQVMQLNKGMKVTFTGRCDGLMTNAIILDCILKSNPGK